uniref:Hairy-related 8.2 n=1 Tax=Salarias fasciatus TaxID=181472 RepID=A0A672H3E7_SALFA
HSRCRTLENTKKPLIERKRRERINNCLDQLKETQSKLEKADILEMTVKHLQNIQNNKLNGKSCVDVSVSGVEFHAKNSFLRFLGGKSLSISTWCSYPSLPRSKEERPVSHPPTPRREAQGTPQRGHPLQLQREAPTRHAPERQERPTIHSSHLGMLEMWRPW